MTYKFFKTEAEANAEVSSERAHGRRAYAIRHRAGHIEVRAWE